MLIYKVEAVGPDRNGQFWVQVSPSASGDLGPFRTIVEAEAIATELAVKIAAVFDEERRRMARNS